MTWLVYLNILIALLAWITAAVQIAVYVRNRRM